MDERQQATEILSESECWELLGKADVGRLAVDIAGQPDIFPINFLADDGGIVFRSAAGTKLAGAVLNRFVAFEIDGYQPGDRTAWSVVVKGQARAVEGMQEVFDAENLPLFPWLGWDKPNFVRIDPTVVTGRRYHIVDSAVPDASIGWAPVDDDDVEPLAARPAPDAPFHPGAPKLHTD
ncbi:MAG TPA: pyridoxamine 5'-phosphate oxidase family protein [Ilumatobacteraceae bacterium]|nr:pyridoxamine 5'-phosphate oxidase family protein [Ilumatobacteraceae bacterium]